MAALQRPSLSLSLAYFPSCTAVQVSEQQKKKKQIQQLDALCARKSTAEAVQNLI